MIGAAVAFTSLICPADARAQSLFGSSGALSSTSASVGTAGRSGSGGGGMTGSSGSSGFGGSTGAMGGAGGSRSGGTSAGGMGQAGQSSLTQSTLNAGDGSLGATVGTSGFVGRGDTAGRFIGSQNAAQQRITGGAQQFSQLQNLNNRNVGNNSNNAPKQLMRPRMQLGFELPAIESGTLNATLTSRLTALPALETRAHGVSMAVDEAGLVTLTGTVANEDDRRMMEILTRMEPGIRDVKNDLTIAP